MTLQEFKDKIKSYMRGPDKRQSEIATEVHQMAETSTEMVSAMQQKIIDIDASVLQTIEDAKRARITTGVGGVVPVHIPYAVKGRIDGFQAGTYICRCLTVPEIKHLQIRGVTSPQVLIGLDHGLSNGTFSVSSVLRLTPIILNQDMAAIHQQFQLATGTEDAETFVATSKEQEEKNRRKENARAAQVAEKRQKSKDAKKRLDQLIKLPNPLADDPQ